MQITYLRKENGSIGLCFSILAHFKNVGTDAFQKLLVDCALIPHAKNAFWYNFHQDHPVATVATELMI